MAKTREQYINEKMDNEAVSFNLVDQHTVERLRRDGIIQVPKKKVDIPKDMQWNQKFIASQMLKGIEHGDSVDKMASSIFLEIFSREDVYNLTDKGKSDLIKRCQNSSIRNARTMVTSAENNGRLDSYKDLAAKGVVQKKEWIATPDDRTRPTHVDIDGEEQDIDKAFSNGCMFPGDGKGPAEEVWMCRCTMTDHIIGFRMADGSVSKVNYTPDKTIHDEQMEEEKERREQEEKEVEDGRVVVNGKDISDTWKRRPDEFDFDIEDVINAQGFDGLPRVVDAEEFDRYVEESNFVAQRTYSAPDNETLEAYQNELYNGKWYVDCSTGGSAYGQGMYCAGNYEGQLTDAIRQEMKDYQKQNLNYSGASSVHATETFTLDKSAKVVDYKDIYREYSGIMSLAEREQITEEYLDKALLSLSKDEQVFAKFNMGRKDISWEEVNSVINNISEQEQKNIMIYIYEQRKNADEYVQKLSKEMSDASNEIRKKYNDVGSYAASKGYDAIRTENGTSGADTIILNRTKVIFLKEK